VVFANAGINRGYSLRYAEGEIDTFPERIWHEVLDVNLFGTISTIRSAAAIMKPQGSGSIVVTASISGMTPDPMVGYPYMTSKTAILGIVRQVSIELAPYGVRINAISPGSVRTNIAKGRPKPKDYGKAWEDTIPMGRFGMPDELKGIALLLASPASSFATGSSWEIDGGGASLTKGRMSDVGPIRAETPTGNI
jgi:NAD(P)-dependent dehydrogenase (short-subunit alcohol dehydrogenase family)